MAPGRKLLKRKPLRSILNSKYLKALKDRLQAENDLRNIGKLDAMGTETEELEALIKLLDARKRKAEALRALEEAR